MRARGYSIPYRTCTYVHSSQGMCKSAFRAGAKPGQACKCKPPCHARTMIGRLGQAPPPHRPFLGYAIRGYSPRTEATLDICAVLVPRPSACPSLLALVTPRLMNFPFAPVPHLTDAAAAYKSTNRRKQIPALPHAAQTRFSQTLNKSSTRPGPHIRFQLPRPEAPPANATESTPSPRPFPPGVSRPGHPPQRPMTSISQP